MSRKGQNSVSKTETEVLEALALNFPRHMKVLDLAAVTGLARQTIYDVAKKLAAKGFLKIDESKPVAEFAINTSVYLQIVARTEREEELFDMNGGKIDAIEIPVSGYGYGEPLFCNTSLPGKKFYISTIQLKPLLKSQVGLIQKLEETIKTIHNLERTYWTISDVYEVKFNRPTCEIGVGSLSFLRTLMTYRQAGFMVLFSAYDELGSVLYHLVGRCYEDVVDQMMMTILLSKIPITKEFVIDWLSVGKLKYVEEARPKISEELTKKPIQVSPSNILATVSDPRKMNGPVKEAVVEISETDASTLGTGFNRILASSFQMSVNRSLKDGCPLRLRLGQCKITSSEGELFGPTILLYGGTLATE